MCDGMLNFAAGLARLNADWKLDLATCGEEIDLSAFGIIHNSCIDGELMLRIFPHDILLRKYLDPGTKAPVDNLSLFAKADIQEETSANVNKFNKDKGQREACGCVVSKDIGQYNTCPHHCVYCYANYSEKMVNANYTLANKAKNSESIVPDAANND